MVLSEFVCLAAGDGEETFWTQLLVVVILAAGWGLYSLARKRAKQKVSRVGRYSQAQGRYVRFRELAHQKYGELVEGLKNAAARLRAGIAAPASSAGTPGAAIPTGSRLENAPAPGESVRKSKQTGPRKRDTAGGMELLATDFLAWVVEQTDAADKRDVDMRRLCFGELVRRGELSLVASDSLKVYTQDEEGFYGKSIRYEAMMELAARTGKTPHGTSEQTTMETARDLNG